MPVPPSVWLDENYDRIISGNKEFQGKKNESHYGKNQSC
jgi:hypothetical protein